MESAERLHEVRLPVCLAVQVANDRRLDRLEEGQHEIHQGVDRCAEKLDAAVPRITNLEMWQQKQNGSLQDIQKDLRQLRADVTRIIAVGGVVIWVASQLADRLIK